MILLHKKLIIMSKIDGLMQFNHERETLTYNKLKGRHK